jgi:hypothetical protein
VRAATAFVALSLTGLAAPCAAQSPGTGAVSPRSCDAQDADAKRAWAADSHSWLASTFHKEQRDISDAWCRIWETTDARDRSFKAENFGRTLFTGEGVHPVVASSLVPGSGFAAGAKLALERGLVQTPLRIGVSADVLASTNGSWEGAAGINFLGTARRDQNDHRQGSGEFIHQHLAELSYFGPSNDSVSTNHTAFGLDRTIASATWIVPVRGGLRLAFAAGGGWFTPRDAAGATVPQITSRFTESTTPAITGATTYLLSTAGAAWRYPFDATMTGYRTGASVALRGFHETSGRPYSFRRLDAEWANVYTPSAAIGAFSATGYLNLSYTSDGDTVPYYLQPTAGGTDLYGRPLLRSYDDYRFRGPNLAGIVVEHERAIRYFLGTLLFADFGQVADRPSAFRLNAFHHSFGAGITLRAGNTTVLRMFYAWGGGEGTRTTFTGSSDVFAGNTGLGLTNW